MFILWEWWAPVNPFDHMVSQSVQQKKMPGPRSYSSAFKLRAIAYGKEHGKHAAAREFKVDRRRIQEWTAQEDRLKETNKTSKRLYGM